MPVNNTAGLPCSHKQEMFIEDVVHEGYPLYIANIVIVLILCIPTAAMNTFVILAIYTTPSLHTSPNILICSLAFTDLASGLVAQPIYVVSRVAEMKHCVSTFCSTWLVSRLLGSWLANASLLTLTAISIDRVQAVRRALRYRSAVRTKRVVVVTIALWILAAFFSAIRLLLGDVRVFLGIGSSLYLLCLLVLCFSYWITFRSLKLHQIQIQGHLQCDQRRNSSHSLNVIRYRHSILTMLYIAALALLCYLPYICMLLPILITGRSIEERTSWTLVDSVLFLNSLLNPILYYWRVKDVRRAILNVVVKPFHKPARRPLSHLRLKRWSAPSGFEVKPACAIKPCRRTWKSMPNVLEFGKLEVIDVHSRPYHHASSQVYDTYL